MYLNIETIEFLQSIGLGVILAVIFDFFRAYKRYKNIPKNMYFVQDIMFFFIAWIVIIFALLKILDGNIRFYLFIGIIIGIMLYISTFSSNAIKLYIKILKFNKRFFEYICLPIKFIIELFKKIYIFFKKIIKKCCKMFSNVIFNIYKFIKCNILNLLSTKAKKKSHKKQKREKYEKKIKLTKKR